MKKNSKRLFLMEMVLVVILLFISMSVTNLIFVRTLTQHQKNEAMQKMSETMVMMSENIQDPNEKPLYLNETMIYFDAKGERVDIKNAYVLEIQAIDYDFYRLYTLNLFTSKNEKLVSWDVVKVVK